MTPMLAGLKLTPAGRIGSYSERKNTIDHPCLVVLGPKRIRRCRIDAMSGSNVVMVPFTPIDKRAAYDIRLLKPHPVALTYYSNRGEGYLSLGSYMSGGNQNETRFPESQPIVMSYRGQNQQEKTMQVYIVTENGGPPPLSKDRSVTLDVAGGEVIAAKRFEGAAGKEVCDRVRRNLLEALAKDGVLTVQDASWDSNYDFQLAQYGPLHSLSPRLNEIWIKVKLI
eukprot:jgi/Picsp_1/5601/NSC_02960-R1_protein